MTKVKLPHNFTPRSYQLPFLRAMDSGKKRADLVWHRRSGKDKTCLNFTIKKMFERVGAYFYFLPTYAQGSKVIWDGMDIEGFKLLDHFPPEIIESRDNGAMKIKTVNGSLFQVIGVDNYDSIMGTNPVGCVFSEFSLQDPRAWDFIRPILRANGGWAVFNYTPRGENHAYELHEMAKGNEEWFSQVLTIKDTGLITEADIESERQAGMSDEMIRQEYYCSFQGALQGAYYAKQLAQAEAESRLTSVPYDTAVPVDTWWDLGIGDAMAVWFTQNVGHEIHCIDYYEATGKSLVDLAVELKSKNYLYGRHFMPHDARARELSSGKTRLEAAESLGIRPLEALPALSVDDGINQARMLFNRIWFDKEKCAHGIQALKNYTKEYDEKMKRWSDKPRHDWASHGADAFRMLAIGHDQSKPRNRGAQPKPKISRPYFRNRFSEQREPMTYSG